MNLKTTNIRKGTHAPFRLPILHCKGGQVMRVRVQVTESMLQATPGYWHKIVGYSRGHHHRNSGRIVWRPDDQGTAVLVAHYYYQQGKRGWQVIRTMKAGQELEFNFRVMDGPKWGYILRPYHGGKGVKAPKDIEVKYNFEWL